jgi:hypothetical protein
LSGEREEEEEEIGLHGDLLARIDGVRVGSHMLLLLLAWSFNWYFFERRS